MTLVIFLFALWLVTGVYFLRRAQLPRALFLVCAGALVLALALRVFSMDHITDDYTYFLSQWVRFFRENGGFAGIKDSVGDYNVPYLYFLAGISYLPVKDLYLIKLFSVFFDLLLAFTALRMARRLYPGKEGRASAAFCVMLLLPTVVLNGAYWAQCDVIYGAFVLLALADALEGKSRRGVIWLGIAFSFKLQAIFVMPLWCILWYRGKAKFQDLLFFPVSYFGTILPALMLGKPLGDILGVYFKQMGQYNDRLTLNAPSLYALIPYGAEVDGPALAKLGILAAFALVAALLLGLFFVRKRLTDQHILAAALILAIGVPLLLPHMHERYFFLAEVLSVIWCLGDLRRLSIPAAVQFAAYGGYHAYLFGRFAYPMSSGALALLCCLLAVLVSLGRSLYKAKKA